MWLQASSLVTPDSGSDNIEEKGTRQMGHESSALMRSFAVRMGRLWMMGSMRSIVKWPGGRHAWLFVELIPSRRITWVIGWRSSELLITSDDSDDLPRSTSPD